MRRIRERRTHALATTPQRQVDGIVEVQQLVFDVPGGVIRLERHAPVEVVVRDDRGERHLRVDSERPDRRLALALPVAAYIAARIVFSGRRQQRSRG